jgi:hypothetical protein
MRTKSLYMSCTVQYYFAQFMTYLIYEDLQVALETITHIVIGVVSYILVPSMKWN